MIVDDDLGRAHGWTVPALARACLEGGARLLQIRAKTTGAGELLDLCQQVAGDAARFGARVIVNDRVDIARLVKGAGVHVGQDDLPPRLARQIVGSEVIVGFSTHTAEQVQAALNEPISYLAAGPVFGTRTKETGYGAVGLSLVRYAASLASGLTGPQCDGRVGAVTRGTPPAEAPTPGAVSVSGPIPIVGIGGITLDRALSVIEAGATAVAVISDVLATGDPAARVGAYVERLG